MGKEKTVISVKGITKSFGSYRAVDEVEFEVKEAECFGLLGPNGAGKTTTMKMLSGKSFPDRDGKGKIEVFGYTPEKNSLEIRALSGIVPQQDNLDQELNVRDNLKIYAKFYGIKESEAYERIEELLEFMELKEKADANVRTLSGGMQRRLTIARALLNKPKLIILDEPTTGLDPQVRHLIWNKLRELKEKGVTVLLTTHYMEEAFQICDRLIIMDRGKKIVEGNPRELLSSSIEKYVMELPGVCKGEESESCTLYFKAHNIRFELFNDTIFAYSNNQDILSDYAKELKREDYYIRHSNLEDLFLKVTGRGLNELQ